MGLLISRSKAIEYSNLSVPISFKERFKTLIIYYFVFVLSIIANYALFRDKYVLSNLYISLMIILTIVIVSIIKNDKVWYNKYFNTALLSISLSFLFAFSALYFVFYYIKSFLVYIIGILIWLILIIAMFLIELRRIKQNHMLKARKNSGIVLLFVSIPGVAANFFYRLVKNLKYSDIILCIVFAICFFILSVVIMPASKDMIRYYYAKKYKIKYEELYFSND